MVRRGSTVQSVRGLHKCPANLAFLSQSDLQNLRVVAGVEHVLELSVLNAASPP